MSRVSSLRQTHQSQKSPTQGTFPGQGHTLQDNHDDIPHHTNQNPRTVTHNQLENAKGTKIVGSLTIAGDIGIENDPTVCAPSRNHDQFKGASDVHMLGGLAISGNISSSGATALASILAALQSEWSGFQIKWRQCSLLNKRSRKEFSGSWLCRTFFGFSTMFACTGRCAYARYVPIP